MSAFEQTLVAELRTEADRISAGTDTAAMRQELDRRLDAAGSARSRRRWISVIAVVAATAVVVGIAAVAVRRDSAEVPPAQGTGWTGRDLLARPQLQLPEWAAGIDPVVAPPRLARWAQDDCGQNPCEAGKDRVLGVFVPLTGWDAASGRPTDVLTWVGAAEYFSELTQSPGVVPVEGQPFTQQPTAGAGVANVAVIATTQDIPGALGCPQLDSSAADCQSLVRGTRTIIAIVDAGNAPLVVWSSALSSTDAAAQDAEMGQVLASLRLTGLPVSCTDTVAVPVAQEHCAADLWARVQRDATNLAGGSEADQSHFDQALAPYLDQLGQKLPSGWAYERGPGDGDDTTSTKPTTASLTVAGTTSEVNVCFVGPQVIIGSGPCPGESG
jgi:hypothetical protein